MKIERVKKMGGVRRGEGGEGRVVGGVRVDVNEELKFSENSKKKMGGGVGGGRGRVGGGVRVDVI